MNNVLLVSPDEVIKFTVIESNVNVKILKAVISNCQMIQLKPILGDVIYNQVIDAVYNLEENQIPIPADLEILLGVYIKNYLIYISLVDFITTNHYKLTNKGVLRLTDKNGQSLNSKEIEGVKDFYENQANTYKLELVKFLKDNNLITCENDINTTRSAIGWYIQPSKHYHNNSNSNGLQIAGLTGPRGFQGIAGNDGIQGIEGNQGFQGVQGSIGVDGSNSLIWLDGDFTFFGNYSTNQTAFPSVSSIQMNTKNINFIDVTNWLNGINVGDIISIVNRNDNSKFGIYTVTNKFPFTDFYNFEVSVIAANGDRVVGTNVAISYSKSGVSGSQGTQGIAGVDGDSGFQGNIGFQGVQGIGGSNGNQGFQGYQGLIGFQGSQGIQGNNGLDGFGKTNSVPKFLTPLSFTNSNISDDGSKVNISTDAIINSLNIGRGGGNNAANIIYGASALDHNLTGTGLVAIGASALYQNTGSNNTAIGNNALTANTSGTDCTAIGRQALASNTTGQSNTGIGRTSLANQTIGSFNLAIGQSSLFYGASFASCVAIGYFSLLSNGRYGGVADDNIGIGVSTGRFLLEGSGNTLIGRAAGFSLTAASGNVFIGFNAGYGETSSNKLYISNSSTGNPLIYGDFASQSVIINNKLNIAGLAGGGNQFLYTDNSGNVGVTTSQVGLTGSTGVQGFQGIAGSQGLQGFQGRQGLIGLQGVQGFQGIAGSNGINGNQGFQGYQGLQGALPSDYVTIGTVQSVTASKIFTDVVGIGLTLSTASSKLHIQRNSIGITQSDAYGLILENTTSAATASQQLSPGIVFAGKGFATTPSSSMDVRLRIDMLPIQNSGSPFASLRVQKSLNGGAYADFFTVLNPAGSSDTSIQLNGSTVFGSGSGVTQYYSGPNGYSFYNSNGSVQLIGVNASGKFTFVATNTAAGTTGNRTINNPSGTVNFAAGATAITVTNSTVVATSIVFAVIRTNDATAQIKNVVPAAGSFVINIVAATAETSVGFMVIN